MQTISILVAEKQELQHQIHEARSTLNLEQTSRQKYQDQLQDSKLRVQTLERELKSNIDSVSELTDVRVRLFLRLQIIIACFGSSTDFFRDVLFFQCRKVRYKIDQ